MQEKNVKMAVFGCRLNSFEAEKIRTIVSNANFDDVIVFNTCAVTAEAERQARQSVRRAYRENPNRKIIVVGCAASANAELFANLPGVIKVIGNRDKFDINAYTCSNVIVNNPMAFDESAPMHLDTMVEHFEKLTRGFVQIQQGCDHACTFCLVRKLRGANKSFPYEHIRAQAEILVNHGYHEIVLTGVDIAGYRDNDGGLISLVKKLLNDINGIKRIRLSSLDPALDWRELVDLMNNDDRVMPHIHLSMQSGADPILRMMGRRHLVEHVRKLVNYANSGAREITFGWDMITGFPGESNELFLDTQNLVRELKPTHLHLFPYSPRPGTPAASMTNAIPKHVARERVAALNEIGQRNLLNHMMKQVGKTVEILVEDNGVGYTPNYVPVKLNNRPTPFSILNAELTDIDHENIRFIGNAKD